MLLRQFRLGNNLPTHIRENTDFLRQKPRQLPSVEANFEGWTLSNVLEMSRKTPLTSTVGLL